MSLASLHAIVDRAFWEPGVTAAGLLVVALTVFGIVGWRSLTRSTARALLYAMMLLATTLVWWLVNSPLEGRVLWVVTANHGFTLGDALGLPAVIMAGLLTWGVALRWFRGRRRAQLG